jgi:predicted DNA-binding transcriptional regulator YafY
VWHHTQEIKRYKNGSVILSFQVDGLEEILWWVLGWSGRAKVIGPEKLRLLVVDQLQAAIRLNEGPRH